MKQTEILIHVTHVNGLEVGTSLLHELHKSKFLLVLRI